MPGSRRSDDATTGTVAFVVVWLASLAAMQWSVVRFRVLIVLVLLGATAALWVWIARRSAVRLGPALVGAIAAGTAATTLLVPVFTYASDPARTWILVGHAAGVLAAAAVLVAASRRPGVAGPAVAVGLVALTHAGIGAMAVRHSPAPRIDVWVVLQQASEALAAGENLYARPWTDSPGISDAFTYLPWTAVLLSPGRLLLGDVRWALLGWSLLGMVGLWLLAGPSRWAGAAGAMMVYLAPGTLTQLDQAWTEPLLFTLIVWWAVLVQRGHAWWGVVPLALACASKQHLALVMPLLFLWRGFGPARTTATVGLAAALVAPWVARDPQAFLHDTVTLLVEFPPIRFANTLHLLAVNVLEIAPPFWLTGLVVAAALGAGLWAVRHPAADLAWVLRICAAVLLTASMVNKQAFYNQFWLVAALVAASLVVESARRDPRVTPSGSAARPSTAPQATTG